MMAVIETAERILPHRLRLRLAPWTRRLAEALGGDDETAHAQRQALIAFFIRIASAAIAFLSQIVLARMMGEFEYGIFAFVWVIVILAGNFSCLGFHTSIIRFLPQHRAEGDLEAVRGLHFTAHLFSLVLASLVGLAGFLFLRFFGDRLEAYWIVPLFLALFILPMVALGDVLDGTARASGWTATALTPTFLVRPVLILVFMVGAIRFGAPRTAVTAMEAALAAAYVTTLLQYLQLFRRLRRTYGRGARRLMPAAWFGYSLPIFMVDGIGYLLTNADVVVVGFYLPPDQVAVYFAATKIIVLVQFVAFAVRAAAGPRFSAILAEGDSGTLAAFAGQTARWSFWPSLAIGLVVLLLGRPLLSLFGPAFTSGYGLLAILFAGILAKAVVGPGEILLSMAGRQKLCMLVYTVVLAVNIGLNIALIPYFGLAGAALATALAMMIEALLLHVTLRRTLGIVLFAFARPQPLPQPEAS